MFALFAFASFKVLFRVLAWAGPAYGGGEPTLMGATGNAMGTPSILALFAAWPARYIPKFKNISGNYLVAFGALFFMFCLFNAIRIYFLASAS